MIDEVLTKPPCISILMGHKWDPWSVDLCFIHYYVISHAIKCLNCLQDKDKGKDLGIDGTVLFTFTRYSSISYLTPYRSCFKMIASYYFSMVYIFQPFSIHVGGLGPLRGTYHEESCRVHKFSICKTLLVNKVNGNFYYQNRK